MSRHSPLRDLFLNRLRTKGDLVLPEGADRFSAGSAERSRLKLMYGSEASDEIYCTY
jgi:hypothetical protein